MKLAVLATLFAAFASAGTVVTFQPSEIGVSYSCCPSVTNQWSAYGITGVDLFWYEDPRDTFDTFGVSIDSSNGGWILFDAPTTLTIDYWVIWISRGVYKVYDSADTLLDTLTVEASAADVLGTYTFTGNNISKLQILGTKGLSQVSTLTFDGNSPIPEPASFVLIGAGIGALALLRRRA
jgi:hypothetical protein